MLIGKSFPTNIWRLFILWKLLIPWIAEFDCDDSWGRKLALTWLLRVTRRCSLMAIAQLANTDENPTAALQFGRWKGKVFRDVFSAFSVVGREAVSLFEQAGTLAAEHRSFRGFASVE